MDDDRKNSRGKPPRSGGAARPGKGGDGAKHFRKHTPARPYEKGGEGFPKRSQDGERPVKRAYAKRQDSAARDDSRSGAGERKPWRKDANDRGGPDAKPFAKRKFGERPPSAEGGERRFVRRNEVDGENRERKPFVKRAEGAPRRDAEGRPQYWGKRPGKAEREVLAKAAPEGGDVAPERREPKSHGRFDRPARRDQPDGDRPQRFGNRDRDAAGQDRPRKNFGERKSFAPREEAAAEDGERIAKRLARAGISSRRDAEELIASGRVKVNGKVLESPAFNVGVKDKIELDGMEIPAIERTRLFLFHKPAGVVTTNRDPEGRKTVFDVLPESLPRLMTVGRLDINTEGLLLLTNDGGLSRVLELPATGWLRRYRVRVHGKVDEQALAGLKDGIAVDGVFYGAIEATLEREQGSNAWLTLGLREGKNREVKNILGALGLDVTRLIRVSYGPFQLGELPEGHVLEIKGRMLRDQLGERLVEESGANFDADIAKPFSNKPVRRGDDRPQHEERPARQARPLVREGEGGLIKGKNFRRDRDREREDFRDRLSTARPERGGYGGPDGFKRGESEARQGRFAKPERAGGKPGFDKKPAFDKKPGFDKRGDRDERPAAEQSARRANVWMAPGSRPQGQGRLATEKAEQLARKAQKTGHRKPGPAKGKPAFGKPRDDRNERPRGDGPRGPRKGGPGADRRR
jgi:23S rRNA pseudouridine2605 synthase